MRILALLAVLLVPTMGQAQTIDQLLIGKWTCAFTITSEHGSTAYEISREYEGKRVRGMIRVIIRSTRHGTVSESVASYKARVRIRRGVVHEDSRGTTRMLDLRDGGRVIVPRESKSWAERLNPGLFPASPSFPDANTVVWTLKEGDHSYQCNRKP